MTLSFLLFLAHIAARALALIGGRAFARVARSDTIERAHLDAVVRRMHAAGKLGSAPFLTTMKQLCMLVAAVAHFADLRSSDRWAGPALSASTLRRSLAHAVACVMAFAPTIAAPDSS